MAGRSHCWAWALALAVAAQSEATASPVAVTGAFSVSGFGTLPTIVLPFSTLADVAGGTLSLPANLVSVSNLFTPITGFPLNIVTGVVVTLANGAGSFAYPNAADGGSANIPGGGFGGKMPFVGLVQIKGALAVNIPYSVVGKGGSLSVGGIQAEGAPWTTRTARASAPIGPMSTRTAVGTAMGLLGAASSTVTLVTPSYVNLAGLSRSPNLSSVTLHFVPEPATIALLGVGVVALAAWGSARPRD